MASLPKMKKKLAQEKAIGRSGAPELKAAGKAPDGYGDDEKKRAIFMAWNSHDVRER